MRGESYGYSLSVFGEIEKNLLMETIQVLKTIV